MPLFSQPEFRVSSLSIKNYFNPFIFFFWCVNDYLISFSLYFSCFIFETCFILLIFTNNSLCLIFSSHKNWIHIWHITQWQSAEGLQFKSEIQKFCTKKSLPKQRYLNKDNNFFSIQWKNKISKTHIYTYIQLES